MKEAISSPVQDPVLPLTPASTPESLDDRFSHKQTDKRLQNNAAVSLTTQADGFSSHDSKPTSVTVGVNTGASLLWDKPLGEKSTCAKCCEYNR